MIRNRVGKSGFYGTLLLIDWAFWNVSDNYNFSEAKNVGILTFSPLLISALACAAALMSMASLSSISPVTLTPPKFSDPAELSSPVSGFGKESVCLRKRWPLVGFKMGSEKLMSSRYPGFGVGITDLLLLLS